MSERLKGMTIRWIEQGWQAGNSAIVDELHDVTFVDHDPAGRTPDREGFKKGIEELYAAFPDFHGVIEDLVVDSIAGKVAVRWSATGTHRGPFLGFPPTGRLIRFKGIEILRIEQDRIMDRWGEWDGLELLNQLR
jgi:steroid delta-isomerase-like uncharacterized protein